MLPLYATWALSNINTALERRARNIHPPKDLDCQSFDGNGNILLTIKSNYIFRGVIRMNL